jgi:hypothetical protein
MKEPHEERGAAEDAGGVPVTPTEEEASRRPPSDIGDTGDQDDETPGGGTARPEDLSPDDFE